MSTNDHRNEHVADDIGYEEYQTQISLIEKFLTELIINRDDSGESDYEEWLKSRLRCELLNGSINPGIVLSVVCLTSFTIVHVGEQLTSIEQIVRFPDEGQVGHIADDESNLTTIFVPWRVVFFLLNEYPNAGIYVNPYCTRQSSHVGGGSGRTALHDVVHCRNGHDNENQSDRTIGTVNNSSSLMVLEILLQACPQAVNIQDDDGDLPIDILTRVILMKEESFKYVTRARNERNRLLTDEERNIRQNNYIQIENELLESWEYAKLLVLTHGRVGGYDGGNLTSPIHDDPIQSWSEWEKGAINDDKTTFGNQFIHGCLIAPSIPMSLVELSIRRFGSEQLSVPDTNGNLPLHLVSAKKLGTCSEYLNTATSVSDDDDCFLLNEIAQKYPEAAHIYNHDGCIPIDLAIKAGRRLDTGIWSLLQANPCGFADNLRRTNASFNRFPMIMASLLHYRNSSGSSETTCISHVIFSILKSYPNLTPPS